MGGTAMGNAKTMSDGSEKGNGSANDAAPEVVPAGTYKGDQLRAIPRCSSNDQASVNIWWRPLDIPAIPNPTDSGAYYPVASFHTHTSTYYWPDGERNVGPSPDDNEKDKDAQVPGLVYDYIGILGKIGGGHPINAPARLFKSLGVGQRPTP